MEITPTTDDITAVTPRKPGDVFLSVHGANRRVPTRWFEGADDVLVDIDLALCAGRDAAGQHPHHVRRYEHSVDGIVTRLEMMIADVKRRAVVHPGQALMGTPPYSYAAREVMHTIANGLGNLGAGSLGALLEAAAAADLTLPGGVHGITRPVGPADPPGDPIVAGVVDRLYGDSDAPGDHAYLDPESPY